MEETIFNKLSPFQFKLLVNCVKSRFYGQKNYLTIAPFSKSVLGDTNSSLPWAFSAIRIMP